MSSAIRVRFEPLRSLAFGSIGADYTPVGTEFLHPVRILKITNLTNMNILVSYDGVTDQEILVAESSIIYDFCSNRNNIGKDYEMSAGTIVYVKELSVAPTSGSVYVTVIYPSNN